MFGVTPASRATANGALTEVTASERHPWTFGNSCPP
jgi:hypothetical protein